jgi:hypothetical protein
MLGLRSYAAEQYRAEIAIKVRLKAHSKPPKAT